MTTTTTRTTDRMAARGEGARWGLQPDQSPATLIPDSIRPGQRVSAFTLSRVAEDYGDAAARALDAALYPCPCCGVAFYSPDGWGLCERCDAEENGEPERFAVIVNEAALEAAGTYSPREEW